MHHIFGINTATFICLFVCLLEIHCRRCSKDVYMTYATSDLTAISASVLAKSLQATGSNKCCFIMVSSGVSWLIRPFLQKMFSGIIDVDLMTSTHTTLHEDYGVFWAWKQKKYKRIAFLRNSVVALANPDDIFSYPPLSAVPDAGWPDIFDTTVMLLRPDQKIFRKLTKLADKDVKNHGTDATSPDWIITSVISEWNGISCVYNTPFTITDTNRDVFKNLFKTIKLIRFTGESMPWTIPLNVETKLPEVYIEGVGYMYLELPFHEKWWKIFSKQVHKKLQIYLQGFNLSLVRKDNYLFLGHIEFHVNAGFFNWRNKSYPKMVVIDNKKCSNEYTTWQQLLEDVRGLEPTGLHM